MVARFVPCGEAGLPAAEHLPERAAGDARPAGNGEQRGLSRFTSERSDRGVHAARFSTLEYSSSKKRLEQGAAVAATDAAAAAYAT